MACGVDRSGQELFSFGAPWPWWRTSGSFSRTPSGRRRADRRHRELLGFPRFWLSLGAHWWQPLPSRLWASQPGTDPGGRLAI